MNATEADLAIGRWFRDFAEQGIFTTDERLIVTSWNAWLERHSGRPAVALVGQPLFEAFPILAERRLDEHYRDALDGKPCLLSHLLHGHLLPMHTRHSPQPTPMRQSARIAPLSAPSSTFNAVVGTITIIEDVTERVASEQELRSRGELLEQRVEERTGQLAREVRERRGAEHRVKTLLHRLLTLQEEERRRIARDLHDHLGQHMTALHLKLEMLRRTGSPSAEWQSAFRETQEYLQQFDRELDGFTLELKLGGIYTLGIVPAVTDQVTRWSRVYGIAADFHAAGLEGPRLAVDVETSLYRITQEALTNVAKHARASSVSVVLQLREGNVVLSVEDDGVGFDPASVLAEGHESMGLRGVLERAALLGGEAQIESRPGAGTTIIVTVRAKYQGAIAGAMGPAAPDRSQ